MTVMQIAHGRHQRDAFSCLPPATNFTAQHRQRFNDQHGKAP